jgi:hypothetical protein
MQTNGNEPDARPGSAIMEAGRPGLSTPPLPYMALSSVSRDILKSAHHLPDSELMRIAGCLRTLADEVMAVVDRRCGARPKPRLVIDNTRR